MNNLNFGHSWIGLVVAYVPVSEPTAERGWHNETDEPNYFQKEMLDSDHIANTVQTGRLNEFFYCDFYFFFFRRHFDCDFILTYIEGNDFFLVLV